MNTLNIKHIQRQTGFTLIEVLVSVVIISIGLLGVASMQYSGLRDSNRSDERSQATIFAYDIADRMRSNAAAVYAGQYRLDANTAPTAPTETCTTNFCTTAQLATLDIFTWTTNLGNALAAGDGEITCVDAVAGDGNPCSPGSVHTVTVMWNEQRSNATGKGCSGNLNNDLFCLSVDFQL